MIKKSQKKHQGNPLFRQLTHITLIVILTLSFLNVQGTTIILTSDQQLNDLLDPDKEIELSTGHTKRFASLREICEYAQKKGDHTLTIAFDEFFRQYREHAATERKLTPDMDEYVDKIKVIADFASGYGLGMGLSLLSPLELGPAFKNQTGENGTWLHYKVGLRDSQTGKFHVPLWQQLTWSNNKGNFSLKLKDYKAYAFKEKHLANTPYKAVDRNDILPLKQIEFDEWTVGEKKSSSYSWDVSPDGAKQQERSKRVAVYSNGSEELKGYDRVLVLLEYEVPEMEYFSPEALPFLKNLLKKYNDKGIKVEHFYSDEMHIQQDWIYFDHHDNGQLSLRYYSPAMGESYQEKYGVPFHEKDILFFAFGPNIGSRSARASQNVQYVFGESSEDIHKTFLFRDRYYKLLNNRVVDLFKDAKQYASELFGVDDFGTFGHSSWAESPTIDLWNTGDLEEYAYKYEYTPNFIWGNTVHQAAAACYDYFKWGEYLEPTRNDFAECGWNDRNYYGAAMSASIGVLNRIPKSYPAFWGMPEKVKERKGAINDAFGGRTRSMAMQGITGGVHRDVDVLILYPMNLVAAEERFGSWVTQYGYANFITAEKLLELGSVNEKGEVCVKDKKYTTIVALFEPLPQKGILEMMQTLANKGGKSIWFGPPPVIDGSGERCLEKWQEIFGINYNSNNLQGEIAAGKRIDFKNKLKDTPSQYILTDFVIDRIYPVEPAEDTEKLAFCDNNLLVGTANKNAYFFGFRPRDDQSASLGYETRTLFEILDRIGVYNPTGVFPGFNDNTEHVSRTTDYLATRFPNGATAIVRHYRKHRESWDGGFSRNDEEDAKALEENPLPTDEIEINNFKVNGHNITYKGRLNMAFSMNGENGLTGFEGHNCKQVTIDGKTYKFSDSPLQKFAFSPSPDEKENEMLIYVQGESKVTIPIPESIASRKIKLTNAQGKKVSFKNSGNEIQININEKLSGKLLKMIWK
jgi:hypothetical protein